MRIGIIGGSGFIGTRLLEELKDTQYELLNLDKAPSKHFPEITQIADVRHPKELLEQLRGVDVVILLAAEHRDDVSPTSLYYDVNVVGTQNVLLAMNSLGIKRIIFTSSVAIYGIDKPNAPNEEDPADPFNHYGKSKWQAEQVLHSWQQEEEERSALIIRPTVVFGEDNRGNVYNLLRQIYSGRFLMIGAGTNKKSMAYVGNLVAFIKHVIVRGWSGYEVYNYADKPDLNMNELVGLVYQFRKKTPPKMRIPYQVGMLAGYGFDALASLTRRSLPISSVRIKKFCAKTDFRADRLGKTNFQRPYSLETALMQTLKSEFGSDKQTETSLTS